MTKKIQIVACTLALLGLSDIAPAQAPAEQAPAPTATAEPTAPVEPTAPDDGKAPAVPPGIGVARLVVATDVSERQPVGGASEFSIAKTPRLFAFVEVENPGAEPAEVTVTWLDLVTGKERNTYKLQIQGQKRWRTWARATAPQKPGSFAVLLRDKNGTELGRTEFTMVD